jgi:hypothetical protein
MKNTLVSFLLFLAVFMPACGSDYAGDNSTPQNNLVQNSPLVIKALFTADQANDLLTNGTLLPNENAQPLINFTTAKNSFTGFYPGIDFYYDATDTTPNLYVYVANDRQVVRVSGGLARMQVLTYEGLFMAMAYGVASFYGGDPKNAAGYSATIQADYYAYSVISQSLYWFILPDFTTKALNQWQTMFSLVSSEHAAGNQNDPLNDPSLACRLQSIQAAMTMLPLPACAGGPTVSQRQ